MKNFNYWVIGAILFLFALGGLFVFVKLQQEVVVDYSSTQLANPSVAMDAKGNFVVVWEDKDGAIFAKQFSKKLKQQSEKIKVSSHVRTEQKSPTISSDPHGNFVVVWEALANKNYGLDIIAQRFKNNGEKRGDTILVNSFLPSDQRNPKVSMDAQGNFVSSWVSWEHDEIKGYKIAVKKYEVSGEVREEEFFVDQSVINSEKSSSAEKIYSMSADADGSFLLAWVYSVSGNGGGSSIFARKFLPTGEPVGKLFQLDGFTQAQEKQVASDMNSKGVWVVAWKNIGKIFGTIISDEEPIGQFEIDSDLLNIKNPAVAIDEDGSLVVVWESDQGIFAQWFDSAGKQLGTKQKINLREKFTHTNPSVELHNTKAVVSWVQTTSRKSKILTTIISKPITKSITKPQH